MALTWAAFPTPKEAIRPNALYSTARYRRCCPRPPVIIYMRPPAGSPSSSVRYRTDRVASAYLIPMANRPQTHIQKMEPGPPRQMAPATPMMFPVPTVAPRAVHSARKEEVPSSACGLRSIPAKVFAAAANSLICGKPALTEIHMPVPRIRTSIGIPHITLYADKSASVITSS